MLPEHGNAIITPQCNFKEIVAPTRTGLATASTWPTFADMLTEFVFATARGVNLVEHIYHPRRESLITENTGKSTERCPQLDRSVSLPNGAVFLLSDEVPHLELGEQFHSFPHINHLINAKVIARVG